MTPRSLRDKHPLGSSNALSRSNTDALQYTVSQNTVYSKCVVNICKGSDKHINNIFKSMQNFK